MPTARQVAVDTHVLLWWQAESDRLSPVASESIRSVDQLVVPSICCWEVAMLVTKGRVKLDRPVVAWVNDLFAVSAVVSADLTPAIAANAGLLDQFYGDPADRLIVATAVNLSLPLITKDRQIQDFAERTGLLTTIW